MSSISYQCFPTIRNKIPDILKFQERVLKNSKASRQEAAGHWAIGGRYARSIRTLQLLPATRVSSAIKLGVYIHSIYMHHHGIKPIPQYFPCYSSSQDSTIRCDAVIPKIEYSVDTHNPTFVGSYLSPSSKLPRWCSRWCTGSCFFCRTAYDQSHLLN